MPAGALLELHSLWQTDGTSSPKGSAKLCPAVLPPQQQDRLTGPGGDPIKAETCARSDTSGKELYPHQLLEHIYNQRDAAVNFVDILIYDYAEK